MDNPNCANCIHFYITLDENRPRACRVFNIKGRSLPSIDVKKFTGYHCPVFKEKERKDKPVYKSNKILDTFA
ncbi:hypothetical protein EW093_05420 [Thiospirochaeta perfilievii]|uniref:Uracil-DNA glycosylase n=1 Tax=Thiospirochaeta perfilievii TaxID=252967 RepID=A0A5C1Q7Z4_9SPIO|nr:hypothetical protein [Thiospirochaeta perfilievii]QEN04165.1 hypothetical protein EW093_05420 [Thiospirochaeta perfilievii]